MTSVEYERFFAPHNPVDTFEDAIGVFDWPYSRTYNDELTITVHGNWCDYHVSVTWHEDIEAVRISTLLDVKVSERKAHEVHSLLALINEQLWIGHFDHRPEEGAVVFRVGLPLNNVGEVTREQCETLLQAVVESCERYYPAFQFVLWAGKTAREALDATMFETHGTA